MNPVDIIVKKRDGIELTADEIGYFVAGSTSGAIPDYQIAAWAMAVYCRGMNAAETTALTLAMAQSGEQLDLHGVIDTDRAIVDKHSSGGVGDKTTLVVAPIVAACGLPVGKMSGRGLSFSGGTIDKLESIDGWDSDLSDARFRRQLAEIGLVIAGQTLELAPADKVLYALRDVTGTVPSLPLIASSIMSKKLAAGADAIVLDVKCGRGAFMDDLESARELAALMVEIGVRAGRRMTALITQMEQPLGNAVGNALEVKEAIETLHGRGPADFRDHCLTVAGKMLELGDKAPTLVAAKAMLAASLDDGSAWNKFIEWVTAQGGDPTTLHNPALLPQAPLVETVSAPRSGFIAGLDAIEVGQTGVMLGGGRTKKGDPIDYGVGIVLHAKVGDELAQGDDLLTIHANSKDTMTAARERLLAAIAWSSDLVTPPPHIRKIID
ncbi:MAG: thymidine phosphorylase [Caldilineaceae bacterium]|nr:thymidine phosphorylase [Caldilineaceae bacterium]